MKLLNLPLITAVLASACSAPALAASYTIDWLDMSATGLAATVTSPSPTYYLPGYGHVLVTYDATPLNWTRNQGPLLQNGSFSAAGNNYAWTTRDSVDAVNFGVDGTSLDYTLTFTLLDGPIAAGLLVLGTAGLGHSSAAGFTTVTVLQNGTFLNDWDLGANFGPTDFSGGVGNFTVKNSLSAPTPGFFNTDLGVTRIDDSVSSLTLRVHHIGQDGIGFNIGLISPVPEPATTTCAAAGLLLLARRRRPVAAGTVA